MGSEGSLRAAALCSLLLWACPAERPAAEARGALRVPLPEGWRATPVTGGLQVGPAGHGVLLLETLTMPLPTLQQLLGLLEREKVQVVSKESTDSFVAVRYRLSAEAPDEGLVGARRVPGRVVFCSSLRGARPDEVEVAMKVCAGVGDGPETARD